VHNKNVFIYVCVYIYIYSVNNICYSLVATVVILTKCHVGTSIRYRRHETRERNAKKRNVCNGYCRNKIAINRNH
jgi:hypothetical protein